MNGHVLGSWSHEEALFGWAVRDIDFSRVNPAFAPYCDNGRIAILSI